MDCSSDDTIVEDPPSLDSRLARMERDRKGGSGGGGGGFLRKLSLATVSHKKLFRLRKRLKSDESNSASGSGSGGGKAQNRVEIEEEATSMSSYALETMYYPAVDGSIAVAAVDELDLEGDDGLALTDRHTEVLRETWKVIYARLGKELCYVGGGDDDGDKSDDDGVVGTFYKLFESFPNSQGFFSQFRDLPLHKLREDIRLSRELQDHAIRVIRVVEKLISRIDLPAKNRQFLLELGRSHRRAGVPADLFAVMGPIFVHAVRPYLTAHCACAEATATLAEAEEAWTGLFAAVAKTMDRGHRRASSRKKKK